MDWDFVDTVRVLSLPSATDRRARLPGHLAEVGIARFDWHDAHGPEAPEVTALYDAGRVARYPPCFRCGRLACGDETCNNVLIPAQVANVASFLAIWRAVAETPQVALILEDDVRFHPWAPRGLRFLKRKLASGALTLRPEVPALLRLGWPHDRHHRWLPFHRLSDRVKMSNPAHIMTSAFARALVERFDLVRTTSDIYLHQLAPRPGEAQTLFPPMATELSFALGEVNSSIHPKQAHLDHLRAAGREAEARVEEARLRRHVKHVFHRPLLVLGHPGGGLEEGLATLRGLGLDVGLERAGADGVASWGLAGDPAENPAAEDAAARTLRALHWDSLVQVVRDPAAAVPAILRGAGAPDAEAFRRDEILRLTGTDLRGFAAGPERAVAALCLWARIVRARAPDLTHRVEDGASRLAEALASRGLSVRSGAPAEPEGPAALDPGPWDGLSEPARALLAGYCETYGYPLPGAQLGG